ncbi:MAG: phosphocholine cytidylyltransferase family protein [Chromatiales bacterium]|nr:phosphocholine cytidylyltransferase family protein [Chromatiales bacterium]
MIRQALILAAGQGTRLAGELRDRPKGFLEIGEQPIISESLARLAAAGVTDTVIVTGHCASWYESLAASTTFGVRTVHNPRFAESGSMYSLWCARELVSGPFLLLESDLVYEPRALGALLDQPFEDALLLSGPTAAGDEVWVSAEAGCLRGMSKQRDALPGPVAGELVGITRVSSGLFSLMCSIAEQAFRDSLHFDYETGCLVQAAARRRIHCVLVEDLLWGEIDDPAHLARVREQVWPLIPRVAAD